MDLTVRTDVIGTDDQSWMGSRHGTNNARTVTLAKAAFTSGTHYPQGFLRSGTPLAKYTSGANTGLYGPYTPGATDGTQTFVGHLLTPCSVTTGAGNLIAPLMDHGRVIEAKLPIAIDTAAKTAAAGRLWYV
jgi:hypothetical protein